MKRFLEDFPTALNDGVGAIFVGAGTSMAAGYPSWAKLLHDIGEELGVSSRDIQDLAALAQWSIQESGGATRVRNVIKEKIGKDYPTPSTLEVIARLAARRIWVSGSWPVEDGGTRAADIYALSEEVGRWIGQSGRDLVSGAGLLVGSAAISGFLEALRDGGGWDLNRRLVARPFPLPLAGAEPDAAKWTALRKELARQAGGIIFIGGAKREGGTLVTAGGVIEEYEAAREVGAFLLPIGATGGAAQEIAEKLIGSDVEATGTKAMRPTDDELQILLNPQTERKAVLECIDAVVTRLTK